MVETRSARKAKRAASPARSPKAASPAARGASPKRAASKTTAIEYEFGGPVGAVATMVLLPVVILGLAVACDADFCVGVSPLGAFTAPGGVGALVDGKSFAVVCGWLGFQAALYALLPGETARGVVLEDGRRLPYVLNGHLAFWISLACLAFGRPTFAEDGAFRGLGAFDLAFLYDDFVPLALAACAVSLVLSAALYAASFRASRPLLAAPGSTGSRCYDFFMGRELNPRVGSFDLKYFCELRPGLIGWAALNFGMVQKQRAATGTVSGAMALVVACQLLYVWDALFHERAILTTMDVTTDGFGYMLAFGDLAWVPFTYCLQARYLALHDPGLSVPALAAVAALNGVGYWVFRGANSQKDAFRRDPKAAIAAGTTFLATERGTKLITSGFWGAARKVNYTGDWLMALAWCATTGTASPIPYFYATYFAILLVHRALRDDHACAAKYGADWPKYKKAVPCLFFPGLF